MTIEEKNSATYLRAYTNWRYQVNNLQTSRRTVQRNTFELHFNSYRLCQILISMFQRRDVYPHQAEEKARVGVRLLGHLLRGASVRGGVQMEIIEIPLSERPIAVACCPVSGDLLVACEKTLVLFTLRRQNQQSLVSLSHSLDFIFRDELHLSYSTHTLF